LDKDIKPIAASASFASWAVYLIIILLEPMVDTILLVNGATIPFWKGEDCYLSPTGIADLADIFIDTTISNEDMNTAAKNQLLGSVSQPPTKSALEEWNQADYQTHLLLAMFMFSTQEDVLARFKDILFMESNSYYKIKKSGVTFDVSKMYTSLSVEANANFFPFINVFGSNGLPVTRKRTLSY
jgi:hypothetical protein